MEDREKLRHLAAHWEEHNRDHAETYRSWAEKMRISGDNVVAEILLEIANETEAIGEVIKKLEKLLK